MMSGRPCRDLVHAILLGSILLAAAVPGRAVGQDDPATGDEEEAVCHVFGRVLDATSGDPIAGVSVWLERESDAAFIGGRDTSEDGSYVIETSACAPAVLHVRMIGYVDAAEEVPFDEGDSMRAVTIRLQRDPVALEALRVEVPRSTRLRDVGFYARREWVESTGKDVGQFYDPDEVEDRSATGSSVLGVAMGSRIRTLYGGCTPSFYIDGTWFRTPGRGARMLSYGLQPWEIEGIEIYRALHGAVPEEYREYNSNTCGAIVVWTKEIESKPAPRIEVDLCEPSDDPGGISFGGLVTDELTGVPLPASRVTLYIDGVRGRGGNDQEVETIADGNGRYRYCDIGAWPDAVQARYGSTIAEPFEVDADRAGPGYWEIDLRLAVTHTGSVVGMVIGRDVERAGTEVALEGTGLATTPDEQGYFEIHGVMPDNYSLVVRRGDLVLGRQEVSIRSAGTEAVTIDLSVP